MVQINEISIVNEDDKILKESLLKDEIKMIEEKMKEKEKQFMLEIYRLKNVIEQ